MKENTKNAKIFFIIAAFVAFLLLFAACASRGEILGDGASSELYSDEQTPPPTVVTIAVAIERGATEAPLAPTMPPTPTPDPTPTPGPTLDPSGKYIALSFDDGPHGKAGFTPDLLETLRKYDVKATFFVVGYRLDMERNATVLRQIAADGHEIGNHTYDHRNLPKYSNGSIDSQLKKTSDKIESITGQRPELFRPPYGESNDKVRAFAKKYGMAVVYWDVSTHDWSFRDKSKILSKLKREAHENAIILCHDTVTETCQIADEMIAWLL
ncbi:MAG: polysaccharide deacetylase family protein, partial [Clostridiales bacterium]|nr:polysaccharide deacetylase family protein [Clostridiales bacterium]